MKIKKGINLIIGRKAIGKTQFIKKQLLPNAKNSVILDLNYEYNELNEENNESCKVVTFNNLSLDGMGDKIISTIENDIDKTLFIEDICKAFSFNHIGKKEKRLRDAIRNKNAYVVFQSYTNANRFIKLLGNFDFAYVFDVTDRAKTIVEFVVKHKGRLAHTLTGSEIEKIWKIK